MAGKRKANEAGSSNGLRGDVLCVLGVLKVATADQIQRLASPHLSYRHTLKKTAALRKEARTASHRGAANDLRRHGLAVDGGRTRGGEEVRLLTKDGLAAAAVGLDRELEEMGGLPKSAGRSGASHPMTVNETVIALIRPKPDLDLVAGEPAEAVAAAQAAVDAPKGIGSISSYATEVALPVKGTWKNPAIGSARADVVVIAPDDNVPLLLIEVDNCTEEAVLIAAKFDSDSRCWTRSATPAGTPPSPAAAKPPGKGNSSARSGKLRSGMHSGRCARTAGGSSPTTGWRRSTSGTGKIPSRTRTCARTARAGPSQSSSRPKPTNATSSSRSASARSRKPSRQRRRPAAGSPASAPDPGSRADRPGGKPTVALGQPALSVAAGTLDG
ncbi:replication-relaxation family protein [Streptomyces sp. NBC_01361]|uniref:replication-relaxation family protein n=1 Tax=Streptomyces sp. NBC_01361 TaxID=2903838 RepID=UPI002E348466|nr:replication-relaxation family protein [Streptomyces sp. NBC_01361]